MKITHTSYFICDTYQGILKKKEVVSYASVRQTHKKEMTCHKVTNLRTEA